MLIAFSSCPICLSNSGICAFAVSSTLFGLQDIQPGSDTVFHSQPGKLDCVLLRCDGVSSDLQLQINSEQQEIVTRNVAD